ncbi:hypothetical protein H257_19386, partial [Aphanomyces astaci]
KEELQAIWDDPPGNAPNIDDDGDASWGPVVLCAAITWNDFQGWLNRNEGRVRRWVFEPLADGTGKGRVVLYSITSIVHSKTAGQIATAIRDQQLILHAALEIMVKNQTVVVFLRVWQLEERCWRLPADNHPYPNVIVEIAYKNKALGRLRAKLWQSCASVGSPIKKWSLVILVRLH